MSDFERAERALRRNTLLVGMAIVAQLACLLDGPLNQFSFVNLAIMCGLLAVSLWAWMSCGKHHKPQLLVTAWSAFIGITAMATLDVIAMPGIFPDTLYINVWGIWALYETVGRNGAYLFAGVVIATMIAFGALTGNRGITAVMVIGSALCFMADQVALRQEVDKIAECIEGFSDVITGNHSRTD